MSCCCTQDKRIVIVRGDDTDFNDGNLLTLHLISDVLDFSTFKAKFVLGGITKAFDDLSSGYIELNYSAQESGALPYGNINGSLFLFDSSNKRATIETVIPFFVTSTVNGNAIATSAVDYTINVQQGGENILSVDFKTNVSVTVGTVETLPAGSDAYVENIGTDNHLVLNFGIPQGDDGESATITVGETQTLPTGQNAYVENVGTASHAVLDFGIPRGEKGEQGEDGQDGLDAKINGVNTLTVVATDGVTLSQSGSTATISGSTLQQGISDINALIPEQANPNNQLADKDFVNSSVATNTANFIGTFVNISALESYSGTVTNNDYAFVINSVVTDNGNDWATFNDLNLYDKSLLTNFDYAWVINGSNFDLYRFDIVNQVWDLRASAIEKSSVSLNTAYNRYKATVQNGVVSWEYEYTLNNSSFTASQWEAINSGATQTNIAQITTNQANIGDLSSLTTTSDSDLVSAINEVNTTAGSKVSDVQINSTSIVNNGIANVPLSGYSRLGVSQLYNNTYGLQIDNNGGLTVYRAQDTDIEAKTNSFRPIVSSTIDKAVKEGITTNTITLTDAEKQTATNWILPTQANEKVLGSDGTDASWDYAVEFIEWSD